MPPGLSCASSSSSHNSRQKMAASFSPRNAARSTCASLGSTAAGGAPSSGTGGKNKLTAMLWTISSSSPPNRAVMRSSIHCVRMSRWARVVSTRREKLAGNLVERTNFVRARSSAMEPVPLMVGIAAVLLGVGRWGMCAYLLFFNTYMMCGDRPSIDRHHHYTGYGQTVKKSHFHIAMTEDTTECHY